MARDPSQETASERAVPHIAPSAGSEHAASMEWATTFAEPGIVTEPVAPVDSGPCSRWRMAMEYVRMAGRTDRTAPRTGTGDDAAATKMALIMPASRPLQAIPDPVRAMCCPPAREGQRARRGNIVMTAAATAR